MGLSKHTVACWLAQGDGLPAPPGTVGDCVVYLVTEIALSLRQHVSKTNVLIELQTCLRAASLRHAMRVQ